MANIDAQKPGWLFILPWSLREIGGVSQVVNSLVRCFRENTEFVPHVLITTRNARTERVNASQAIDQLFLDLWSPIDKQHIAKALFSFVYRFPLRYRALHRIVIQQNIRVINAHFPGLNVLMFIALRKFGGFSGQVILSFHGSDVKAVIQTVGFERFLWKIALRDVDRITVVSNSLRMELLTFEPRVAEKVTTIYNGVDLKMFTPRQNDQGASPRESVQVPTIIGIGSFLEVKGHDVLVQAFSLVVERIPNARLVLVGNDGPALMKIRHLIDLLHLADRVFLEIDIPHERIPSLLAGAHLFALASRREGFPLVLAEAAAAKLPIVSTRVGGIPELITDGVTGRLVDTEDPIALANAIISLLRHPTDAKRFAANCFEYVKSNLTWRQTYDKYLRLSRQF